MSSRKNSFLTPCRQVGLKRKSFGSTPPNTGNVSHLQQLTPSSTANIVNDETRSRSTSDSPQEVLVGSRSSPIEQRQLVSSKRLKRTVIPRTPTISETESAPQDTTKSNEQILTTETRGRLSSPTSFRCATVPNVESSSLRTHIDGKLSLNDIRSKIDQTRERLSAKQTEIDRLRSQSANAKQHDLRTLDSLILKWRRGCQNALNELVREQNNRNRQCSIPDLLKSIGIPAKLVQYSDVEMDFYE